MLRDLEIFLGLLGSPIVLLRFTEDLLMSLEVLLRSPGVILRSLEDLLMSLEVLLRCLGSY